MVKSKAKVPKGNKEKADPDKRPDSHNHFKISLVLLAIVAIICVAALTYPAICKIVEQSTPEACKNYLIYVGSVIVGPLIGWLARPHGEKFISDE